MLVVLAAAVSTWTTATGVAVGAPKLPSWSKVEATLSDHVDPSSKNVCNRGDAACVDVVLAEMQRRLKPIAARCSHLAPFAVTYAAVTEQFRGGWPWTFTDPSYIAHLDALFARAYFDAYDAWKREKPGVAPAWEVAFDAARDKSVTALGDMLLGMNAHITNDLPFVLEKIGLTRADGSDAYFDYAIANAVIAEAQDASIDTVAKQLDPDVTDVNIPGLVVGREGFIALIGTWRAESWVHGQQLLAATSPGAHQLVVDEITRASTLRAALIRAATSYLPVVSSTADRDEYCRAQRA